MKFQDTLYNFNGQEYTANAIVDLDMLCNGLNVINIGTTVATINGVPLSPPAVGESVGDSYSIGGNRGEVLNGRVQISFAGGTGKVIVVQKFYLNQA